MTVRPIVCGTELGETGTAAVELAATLARALQAPLELVHALDMANDVPPTPPTPIAPAVERLAARVKERVDHARQALGEQRMRVLSRGVECAAQLEQGRPWEAIVRRATELHAAFVVVGPHGPAASVAVGAGRRLGRLLGSTADRVVRHSPCPVLVATFDGAAPDTLDYAAWIVGVDFSAPSLSAIAAARRLAHATSGTLTLARVLTPWEDHDEGWAADVLRRTGPEPEPGLAVSAPVVLRGNPADELAQLGESTPRAVLVVGTHARSGLARFVLGSTTERLLRLSRVPVLCVRDVEDTGVAASERP